MSKIYQPLVIDKTNEIIEILNNDGFFVDNEIDNYDFAITHLRNKLTEKFILGELDDEGEIFREDELQTILKEIVAGCILEQLKKKGLVGSYDDEGTEEIYFLTEEGKEYMKNKKD